MPICPYCEKELHLDDFFQEREIPNKNPKKKPKIIVEFTGEIAELRRFHHKMKMFVCPSCDRILGFSEFYYDSAQ